VKYSACIFSNTALQIPLFRKKVFAFSVIVYQAPLFRRMLSFLLEGYLKLPYCSSPSVFRPAWK